MLAIAKTCCLIDYDKEMYVVELFTVIKLQLKFASNFCCVIVVITYLRSHYFIKVLVLMLMSGVGKGLILFTPIVNLSFQSAYDALLQRL